MFGILQAIFTSEKVFRLELLEIQNELDKLIHIVTNLTI